MRVLALVPAYKEIQVESVQSLCALQAGVYSRGDRINIAFVHGFNAASARTQLLKYAVSEHKAKPLDYVLNIDSDQTFTAEHLYKLIDKIEENKLDLLSAGYLIRAPEKTFAHGSFDSTGYFQKIKKSDVSGIVECDVLGFGFLLMKPEFVVKMVEAYGNDIFKLDCIVNSTEDVYFCRQAKRLGTKICFDADNIVGHLMTVVMQ